MLWDTEQATEWKIHKIYCLFKQLIKAAGTMLYLWQEGIIFRRSVFRLLAEKCILSTSGRVEKTPTPARDVPSSSQMAAATDCWNL